MSDYQSPSDILDPELEPAAVAFAAHHPHNPMTEALMISAAVSLKRIADAMTETNEYGEGTAAAIGGNLRRAMQGIESSVFQAMNRR